jgi:hypothetical protein
MSHKSFEIPLEQRREFMELLTNLNKLMAYLEQRAPAIYQLVKIQPAMLERWNILVGIVSTFTLKLRKRIHNDDRWPAHNTSAHFCNRTSLLASYLRHMNCKICSYGLNAALRASSGSWPSPLQSSRAMGLLQLPSYRRYKTCLRTSLSERK